MPDTRIHHPPNSALSRPHHYGQAPPNYPPAYQQHHHHSSRHASDGHTHHSQQQVAPSPMPAGPPEPAGPPSGAASNSGSGRTRSLPPVSLEARAAREKMDNILAQLAAANENTWMLIGAVAEGMHDQDRALSAFENALRHNPTSVLGLNAVAAIARSRDDFDKAIEYFQRILNDYPKNGDVWGSMGHCLLMKDDLPKAYTSYQQALYHLQNPKEPKLWYGIGILYDRYGSFEHAEEAFSSVLKVDPNFEKANEIYFRLGIIYKHQRKYKSSLECFRYILNNPPRPLTSWDIWFQLGHVYEQDRDFDAAREAYNRVLSHQPNHAKVLQQLGWLYNQPGASFADQERAVAYLTKSLETDPTDAQSWYLLGRAYMSAQRYNKAYEAYQQAVYRDGRNPTFWCSIGVLYYQISQYRDALDAYSRAIRLNPYIGEVWYNLGSLYESCNNQVADAMDAYSRAVDLDPGNVVINQRMALLQNPPAGPLPPVPPPVDVHPSQYTATPTAQQPPGASPAAQGHPALGDAPIGGRDLPPPPPGGDIARGHSPGPFRNGIAPPPLTHVDESRGPMAGLAPLARMVTEPQADARDERYNARYDPALDGPSRRHPVSPPSPQISRRGEPAYNAQPSYALPPSGMYQGRDHGREGWERSRAGSRALSVVGPSPRMDERAVDPRMAQERYMYDHRSFVPQGTPNVPGRYDPHREAEEYRRREEERDFVNPPGPPLKKASPAPAPAPAPATQRKASPAPSAASKAGKKRERGNSVRRAKDKDEKDKEKPVSAKKRGKAAGLKASVVNVVDEVNGSPRGSILNDDGPAVGTGGGMATQSQKIAPVPASAAQSSALASLTSRTVDEDYDEGAADALMALAGTNASAPILPPMSYAAPPSDTPRSSNAAPANAYAGNKRPGPEPPSPEQAYKRAKGDKSEKSESPSGSTSSKNAKRMVIEVLNAPSIASPLPRSASAAEGKEKAVVSPAPPAAPQEEEKMEETTEDKVEEKSEEAMVVDDSPVEAAAPAAPVATSPSPPPQASSLKAASPVEAPAATPELAPTRPSTPPSPQVPATPVVLDQRPATPPLPPALAVAPVPVVEETVATPPASAEKAQEESDIVMGESEAEKNEQEQGQV